MDGIVKYVSDCGLIGDSCVLGCHATTSISLRVSLSVCPGALLGYRRCPYVPHDYEESTRRDSSKILPKLHAPIYHHVLELGIPQLADKEVRVEPIDSW